MLKAVDFVTNGILTKQCRYRLSGTDACLKWYIVDLIAERAGLPKKYITSTKDTAICGELFDNNYIAVVSPEMKVNLNRDYTIVVEKEKNLAVKEDTKNSKNDFVKINCSTLFPDDLKTVVSHMLFSYGIDKVPVHDLIRDNFGDLVLIGNYLKLMQYGKLNALSTDYISDIFKVINYFLDKNYKKVMELINLPSFDISEFIWSFAMLLEKMYSLRINMSKGSFWYNKRLEAFDRSLTNITLPDMIVYINKALESFNKDVMLLKLNKLLYSLIVGLKQIG